MAISHHDSNTYIFKSGLIFKSQSTFSSIIIITTYYLRMQENINQECLLSVKSVANIHDLTDQQIKDAFKQYGLGRIVKYEERN